MPVMVGYNFCLLHCTLCFNECSQSDVVGPSLGSNRLPPAGPTLRKELLLPPVQQLIKYNVELT